MKWLTLLIGMIILLSLMALRFLPFLVVAYIIVHFLQKWW